MDYQNVHLTGHELFGAPLHLAKHETLLDPLLYGQQLIQERNARQKPGHPHARLTGVQVYRGQPSEVHDPTPYRYSQANKSRWERDSRVKVTYRPLKYYYEYGADGRVMRDVSGQAIYSRKEEKGVDVLVALAVMREAQRPEVDLVLLATTDTDLAPVLDEACSLNCAKIETVSWWSPQDRNQQLRADGRSVWNTRLNQQHFERARDLTQY